MQYPLNTPWTASVDAAHVREEYPRPQLRRDSFYMLNGIWQYAITPAEAPEPENWEGDILVPFSPEASLSGVNRMLEPTEALWYRRYFSKPKTFVNGRCLLHFGAVDQTCRVILNGHILGEHTGGYLPFSFDCTDALLEGNQLIVAVRDVTDTGEHSRGKQKRKRGGIWYTPQSGIWQPVWLECVPATYISGLAVTPQFDLNIAELTVTANADLPVHICLYPPAVGEPAYSGDPTDTVSGKTNTPIRIAIVNRQGWTPEEPYLYPFTVTMGEDTVKSYFAMRKVEAKRAADGYMRFFVNDRPLFMTGVLDQGYWPDGLYTAPSDEAMAFDIASMKRMGFNMLRKHIKIEPLRWYYHCDVQGMLVWQDMVNGGGQYRFTTVTAPVMLGNRRKDNAYRAFSRTDEACREQYYSELEQTVRLLYNVPCVVCWVPFNEGWGQFDALEAEKRVRALDGTRLIDHASGWHDQGGGDMKSLHIYFKPIAFKPDERAIALTEFGGYNLALSGHVYNDADFGYHRCKTREQLAADVSRLYEKEVLPAIDKGLAAAVYTQLSDVEDEQNGLISYDRQVLKLNCELVKALNDACIRQGAGNNKQRLR